MWAPIFIEISYGQAVMQVPSFSGLQWLLLTDNVPIQSNTNSFHSSLICRESSNQSRDFGLLTIQGCFRFQRWAAKNSFQKHYALTCFGLKLATHRDNTLWMMSLFTLTIAVWFIDIVRRNYVCNTAVMIKTRKLPYVIWWIFWAT